MNAGEFLPSRRLLVAALFGLMLVAPFATAPAQAAEPVFAPGGVAIGGADAVAYFTQGKPVIGRPEFAHRWNGATWHFVSATNRDAFAASPAKYAPQYGGYCAWAVSKGALAKTDPDAWSIVDGKLYLNFDKSTQAQWSQDKKGNIARADQNWPALKNR